METLRVHARGVLTTYGLENLLDEMQHLAPSLAVEITDCIFVKGSCFYHHLSSNIIFSVTYSENNLNSTILCAMVIGQVGSMRCLCYLVVEWPSSPACPLSGPKQALQSQTPNGSIKG